jgi:hypothetical protein
MSGSRKVTVIPRTIMVRTDDLTRHPESQVRAASDPKLVAEYAEAMLEGAAFPPIVVYQDERGWKYLGDGNHRVDAAALAALRDSKRKAEVLAEIRAGTFEDALRHAMRANASHGKRMAEADYVRAIKLAFDHDLIRASHAKDVVPEIVALTGCSIRTAQVQSAQYRREMLAKRDRLIWSMHQEGRTQEAIGADLDVPQQTVSRVIDGLTRERKTAEMGKPKLRKDPPPVALPTAVDEDEPPPPAKAPAETIEPRYRIDLRPFMPLLDGLRPIEESDQDSGAVGALADVAIDDEPPPDPVAARDLAVIEDALIEAMTRLNKLPGLRRRFGPKAAISALAALDRAIDFLNELKDYIEGED